MASAKPSDAVVADDVSFTGELDAAGVLDPFRARPGRGAFDQVVCDEVILRDALRVAHGVHAVVDAANVAATHDDPG